MLQTLNEQYQKNLASLKGSQKRQSTAIKNFMFNNAASKGTALLPYSSCSPLTTSFRTVLIGSGGDREEVGQRCIASKASSEAPHFVLTRVESPRVVQQQLSGH